MWAFGLQLITVALAKKKFKSACLMVLWGSHYQNTIWLEHFVAVWPRHSKYANRWINVMLTYCLQWGKVHHPACTWRWNNLESTSHWRHDVTLTSIQRFFTVVCQLASCLFHYLPKLKWMKSCLPKFSLLCNMYELTFS